MDVKVTGVYPGETDTDFRPEQVSRGNETPGYGANRLRRIGADQWPLVRGV